MSLDSPKTRLGYFILALLMPLMLSADGISFMGDVLEQSATHLKNKKQIDHAEKKEYNKDSLIFFLSSIVYFDDDHWTIWLNEEKILPSQKKYLKVDLIVKKNSIEIRQKGKDEDYYTLMPNQTINLKSKKICSGDERDKFEKEEKENIEGENFDF